MWVFRGENLLRGAKIFLWDDLNGPLGTKKNGMV